MFASAELNSFKKNHWKSILGKIRDRLFFPLSFYIGIVSALLLPIKYQKNILHVDPTGSVMYNTSLAFLNPVMTGFNIFAVTICITAGVLAYIYAYDKLRKQRYERRVTFSIAWASLTVSIGLVGVLGNSIGILNLLLPTEPWGFVSLTLSVAVFGLGWLMRHWLKRESQRFISCLAEF